MFRCTATRLLVRRRANMMMTRGNHAPINFVLWERPAKLSVSKLNNPKRKKENVLYPKLCRPFRSWDSILFAKLQCPSTSTSYKYILYTPAGYMLETASIYSQLIKLLHDLSNSPIQFSSYCTLFRSWQSCKHLTQVSVYNGLHRHIVTSPA
jgi:hypothetical protein